MSYEIFIGEAEIAIDLDDGVYIIVRAHAELGAPTFANDEMTGNENHRHPSYTAWTDFANDTGLHEMFFEPDEGLMRHHPGEHLLKPAHHEQIKQALAEYRVRFPSANPAFNGTSAGCNLARLIWLEFWVGWALANCKVPTLSNY